MYKIISTTARTELQEQINHLEINGFTLVCFSVVTSIHDKLNYTTVMHKPDTAPAPHMTTEQYLAMRTPMERIADTADNVLREEARQYGATK